MKRTFFSTTSLTLLALLMAGCSESTAPAKKAAEKKPAEPVTGQSAIFQTYQVARTWASDAMLLKLESGDIPEAKPQPGKYGLWRALYVSQSKAQKREYVYAASDSEGGILKGVRAGAETPYARNPQVFPFAIQEIKADTPTALETAMKEIEKDKDLKKIVDEDKATQFTYLLDWQGAIPKPQWRLIFGPSVSQSKFSILIDANSGKFVKKMH